MIPEEPRTPYEDDESPLDEAASDAAAPPDVPTSPTDTLILPPSGGPPRVVAETPVGGLRPAYRAPDDIEEPPLPVEEEASFAAEDVPALVETDEGAVAEAAEVVSETPVASAEAGPPAESEPDDDAILAAEPEPEAEPVAAPEPRRAEALAETAEETATETIAEIADAAAAEVPDLEAPASVVRAVSSAAEDAPAEPEPAVAPAAVEEAAESLDSAQEWDEDLSPALAAVLFGSPRRPPAEAAPEAAPAAGQSAGAVVEAAPPAARPRAAQVAGPIRLTEETQARALPLTVGEQAAPAPDVMLIGKVRHTRLEEPLKNEGGQRVVETWDYFKPDYPGLDGQLVRAVRSEDEGFSDGSWRWRYERQYADGGRDRREVRANADRTYFERVDEIALRDPETGKRQQIKEEAGMIFAPPPREEKRGLFSSLLRRGDDQPTGPASWRAATPGEMRQASRDGGRAFRRGLFG